MIFNKLTYLAALVTLAVIVMIIYDKIRYEKVNVKGRSWPVLVTYDNSTDAAKLLHDAHSRVLRFLRVVRDKYHIDETADVVHDHSTMNVDHRKIIDTILDDYNPDSVKEHAPLGGETSFTRNKGQSMHICLREKSNPQKLVSRDDLLFVLLHEISHIGAYDTWGHTPRFWQVFKFILKEAAAAGVYMPRDYARRPSYYCGLKLTHNPMFDPTIPDI